MESRPERPATKAAAPGQMAAGFAEALDQTLRLVFEQPLLIIPAEPPPELS
jgi:hypothetical protein